MRPARLEQQVLRELQVLLVLRALQVLLVLRELLVRQVPLEPLVRRGPQVRQVLQELLELRLQARQE